MRVEVSRSQNIVPQHALLPPWPPFLDYFRKSSDAEDRQILSIQSQVTEFKRFAAQKGIKILEVLALS